MTPQQLKALLPPANNKNKRIAEERLYNLKQLGAHFNRDPFTLACYIKKNNISCVKATKARYGYHRYYRLSSLANYKPVNTYDNHTNLIKKYHQELTLGQRIKLLFGFYI